mgnify:CR=1 FL=1
MGATHAAGSTSMMPLFIILLVMVLFYVWMWRNQSKKTKSHRDLLGSLGKGDEVMTAGGIAGKVSSVNDNYLQLTIAKETEITVQKSAISTVLPKGTLKTL